MRSICPECKYEYIQGIVICPDCLVDLVQSEAGPTASATAQPERPSATVALTNHGEWVTLDGNIGEVSSLGIDHSLQFTTSRGFLITLGSTATLVSGRREREIAPTGSAIGPFVDLLRRKIVEIRISKMGRLEIDFDQGDTLVVPEDSEMEEWSIYSDEDGTKVACAGPGSVVVWPGDDPVGYSLIDGQPVAGPA